MSDSPVRTAGEVSEATTVESVTRDWERTHIKVTDSDSTYTVTLDAHGNVSKCSCPFVATDPEKALKCGHKKSLEDTNIETVLSAVKNLHVSGFNTDEIRSVVDAPDDVITAAIEYTEEYPKR